MGLSCKPMGETKSRMMKLQNRLDAEAKAREEAKRKKKEAEKVKAESKKQNV